MNKKLSLVALSLAVGLLPSCRQIECGDGTIEEDGVCRANGEVETPNCGQGFFWDTVSGMCRSQGFDDAGPCAEKAGVDAQRCHRLRERSGREGREHGRMAETRHEAEAQNPRLSFGGTARALREGKRACRDAGEHGTAVEAKRGVHGFWGAIGSRSVPTALGAGFAPARAGRLGECSPHSVFAVPLQRPARSSSPNMTARVHGQQPMLV